MYLPKQKLNGSWDKSLFLGDIYFNIDYKYSGVLDRLLKCTKPHKWTVAALVALEEFYSDLEHVWSPYRNKAWQRLEKVWKCKRTGQHPEETCEVHVKPILLKMGTLTAYDALI